MDWFQYLALTLKLGVGIVALIGLPEGRPCDITVPLPASFELIVEAFHWCAPLLWLSVFVVILGIASVVLSGRGITVAVPKLVKVNELIDNPSDE